MVTSTLLNSHEVDHRLGWNLGRAERLARKRRLPHYVLPDGSIRFLWEEIESLIVPVAAEAGEVQR
jgi:hypothetical protein